jgi:N-acetylglucosaminyl-diphospho-decaprenol L-rhamnosyltransferase
MQCATTPQAVVIIVTYNSRAHFARLARALDAQTERRFRLIIWDNASRAPEKPTPQDFPDAELVLHDSNLGFATANNRAAAMAPECEMVVLLNPDAFPEPDWLERLIAAAQTYGQVAAFGSTQIAAQNPSHYDGLGDCYHVSGVPWRGGFGHARTEPPRNGETFSACAAAVLYRRAAWDAVGGFDERFFSYGEDVDIGFRMRLLGWPTMQISDAIVHHVGGASAGQRSTFAVFHGTRNRTWIFVKCMPLPALLIFAPAHLAILAIFLAASPFRGTGVATWRGVGAAILGIPAMLRARRTLQGARRASNWAILHAMAWSPLALARRRVVLRRTPKPSANTFIV